MCGEKDVCEIRILSAQLYCELKNSLKKKV